MVRRQAAPGARRKALREAWIGGKIEAVGQVLDDYSLTGEKAEKAREYERESRRGAGH